MRFKADVFPGLAGFAGIAAVSFCCLACSSETQAAAPGEIGAFARHPSQLLQSFHKIRRRLRRRRHGRHTEREAPPEDKSEAQAEPPPPPVKRPSHLGGRRPAIKAAKENDRAAEKSEPENPPKPEAPYGPPPPPPAWTEAEIASGRKECDRLLSGAHAIYERLEPIKEGACGLPAPIRLEAFDNRSLPPVEMLPPATISCKLTVALRRWIDEVVQPEAKARLDATIVRIDNLSAYGCRTRYGNPLQRISQHAYANAIDIAAFVTAKGETVSVLDHWDAGDERAAFLRDIHDGACKIFGTTLGPEANASHKNHFHLDMIDRRRPLCDFTPAQLAAKREAEARAKIAEQAAAAAKKAENGKAGSKTAPTPAENPAKNASADAPPKKDEQPKAEQPSKAKEALRRRRRRGRHHIHSIYSVSIRARGAD